MHRANHPVVKGRWRSGCSCVEGSSGHLHFQCRIGHVYALGSLLAAKEEAIEQRLWSALVSCEELAVLLEELQELGEPYTAGEGWTAATERTARLRASAGALRKVIDDNRAIDLGLDAGFDGGREPSCRTVSGTGVTWW